MLKVFFDTEFTGFHQYTTLISIGLISEKGDTFYAEFNDYDERQCDDWIKENVIANLKFSAPAEGEDEHFCRSGGEFLPEKVELRGSRDKIAQYLHDWFQDILGGPLSWEDYYKAKMPGKIISAIELWSDYLSYNFVLFNQLWGHAFNTPKCVYYIPFDICTLFKIAGVNPEINREKFIGCMSGGEKHNALWNAQITKQCYHKLMTEYFMTGHRH